METSQGNAIDKLSLKKAVLFSLIPAAALFALLEITVSGLYIYGKIKLPSSVPVFEETGATVRFDPVAGYRLTGVRARFARLDWDGRIEFVGAFEGNSDGFPAGREFVPERSDPGAIRLAVLGDSFTAGTFLETNWPRRVEEIAAAKGLKLELLNFSLDGIGLASWRNIAVQIIQAKGFELDGAVFAVGDGDMRRRLFLWDHRDPDRFGFAYAPSWNPADAPKTFEEARELLRPVAADNRPYYGYIAPRGDFARMLEGEWRPGIPRPWKPYLTMKIVGKMFPARKTAETAPPSAPGEEAQADQEREREKLIGDIAAWIESEPLPCLVAQIRYDAKSPWFAASNADTPLFAERLGADLVDGIEPFAGMSEAEIQALRFRYDGHWNQKGSDVFAEFMAGTLSDWIEKRGVGQAGAASAR
jgi:hypothetical protein